MTIERFATIPYPRSPINNVTPFTYRDGYTYLEVIEALRDHVNNNIVPTLQGNVDAFLAALDNMHEAFLADLNDYNDRMITNVAEFQRIHDEYMADVNASLMALNDVAVSSLVNDKESNLSLSLRDLTESHGRVYVTDYGAVGDGVTDDTQAIRDAIAATPVGGTCVFPATGSGYRVTQQAENYVILVDKKISLEGSGPESSIYVDPSVNFTTDIVVIRPPVTNNKRMRISGLNIIGVGSSSPGRHALHIDLSTAGAIFSDGSIENNIFYPTGGNSIQVTNPYDGFFTSQINRNMIWGGVKLDRAGDSITMSENTIAGFNSVDVAIVEGSAQFVFEKNNVTCRGGMIVRSGHGIIIQGNNFESGYPDSTGSDNALLNLDGGLIPYAWGLLTARVVGNNFGFRSDSTDMMDGLRVNKARGTIVEGNHFGFKNGQQIRVTSLATETIIKNNLYSTEETLGIVEDAGRNTLRVESVLHDSQLNRRIYTAIAPTLRTHSDEHITYSDRIVVAPKTSNNAPNNIYEWNEVNGAPAKHALSTRKRNNDGTAGPAKNFATIGDGYLAFAREGLMLYDQTGALWRIQIDSAGVISGTKMV